MVGLEQLAIACRLDRQRRVMAEQFGQQAFVRGVEMHDDDEGQAGAGRHRTEQAGQRLKAARGRADAHHRQHRVLTVRAIDMVTGAPGPRTRPTGA